MMNIKPIRIALILAITTILFGYTIGSIFGAANSSVKHYLHERAYVTYGDQYKTDKEKKYIYSKSSSYLKRAHLHSAAIGSAALGTIIVIGFLNIDDRKKKIISLATGIGASGYGIFVWSLMAFITPVLGKSGAHEALAILAIPTGLSLVFGTAATLYFLIVNKDKNEA